MKKVSDDIGMSFGLDKCSKVTFKWWKLTGTASVELTLVKDLEQEEVYKYVGVDESNRIQHAAMKEEIEKSSWRVLAILKTTQLRKSHRSSK